MIEKSHAQRGSLNITKDTWFLCPFSALHAQYQSVKVYISKNEQHIYIFTKPKKITIIYMYIALFLFQNKVLWVPLHEQSHKSKNVTQLTHYCTLFSLPICFFSQTQLQHTLHVYVLLIILIEIHKAPENAVSTGPPYGRLKKYQIPRTT